MDWKFLPLRFSKASNVSYDNGASGLLATDVQAAIDEISAFVASGAISGNVATFAALPAPATQSGKYWAVTTSTGIWGINRAPKGIYYSTGSAWIWMADSVQDFSDLIGTISAAQHGSQTTETLHAVATQVVAGFMSAVDKTKLDGISGTRIFKSGTVAGASFAGNPKKFTVTFGTAMPSTAYAVSIVGEDGRTWSYETKTTAGFVINANANLGFTGEVSWTAISNGESVE